MKSDRIMNLKEVNTAAINIDLVESSLGHKIPAGLVDATELSDHILDVVEVAKITANIEMIERSRRSTSDLGEKIGVAIIGLIGVGAGLIYAIAGIIYGLITSL